MALDDLADVIVTLGAASALTRDLPLPAPADPRGCGLETPLCGLRPSAELGAVVVIVPAITPAAGDAAGREDGLSLGVRGHAALLSTGRCHTARSLRSAVMPTERTIPEGFCECGCGQRTAISRYSAARFGYVKGQPRRFLPGHRNRITHNPLSRVVIDSETGCQVWPGWFDSLHGPMARVGEQRVRLLPLVYERAHGPLPPSHEIWQTCRNRRCLNGDHLVAERRRDSSVRRRRTKLNPETVREIRRALADPYRTERDIAAEFGISRGHVNNIKRGHAWKHVV